MQTKLKNYRSFFTKASFKAFCTSLILATGLSFTSCDFLGNESTTTEPAVVEVTNISIKSSSGSTLYVGDSTNMSATVTPSDAEDKTVKWTSKDKSIIQINKSSGKATAVGAGTTYIYATATNGVQGKKKITVKGIDYTVYTASDNDFNTLVWSDEFNGTSLDTSVWNYETGGGGWGNGELQTYVTGNVSVSGGSLIITADSSLHSSRINTKEKLHIKYGKIVSRMKMSNGTGSWPAFWMLGGNYSSVGWPACGEIDIMEHADSRNYIQSTMHWNSSTSTTSSNYKQADYGGNSSSLGSIDFSQWHEITFEWTSSSLKFYVDGSQYFTMGISSSDGINCFQKPFFFIYNFAMGGQFMGNYDSSSFTNLPWKLEVDYLRVYQ